MDSYDQARAETHEFTPSKAGIKGYFTWDNFRVDAMNTATKLTAARLSYAFKIHLFGCSIILGATAIRMKTGVHHHACDFWIEGRLWRRCCDSCGRRFYDRYVEYAMLRDNGVESGKGGSVGVKGDFGDLFTTG